MGVVQRVGTAVVVLLRVALLAVPLAAAAQAEPVRKHALSLINPPEYPADFSHFKYVNPAAPAGGTLRLSQIGTFDTLNPFAIKGVPAAGLALMYDQLLASSLDEPSVEYAQVAEWVSHPDDYSSVTFGIREGARWHDGEPVTVEDVIFSFEALKANLPFWKLYWQNVTKAEQTGPREVTFSFDVQGNRELPLIMGQLSVLPKHYWTGTGADGQPRDITKTTLEPPLGSGPYRIASVTAGRTIVYERVADYWGKDLAVARGQFNFGEIRQEYFRDQTAAFEQFKAGALDLYIESSAKNWATAYDFDATKDGRVVKQNIALKTGEAMQAFVFNTRRAKFQDRRLRRAFNHAFDFEWANKNLFFDQYSRVGSYFQNTELAASGLPEGAELAILESVRDKVPAEVFTKVWANPTNSDPGAMRKNLGEAQRLLNEAGWRTVEEAQEDPNCGFFCKLMITVGLQSRTVTNVMKNSAGEKLEVEFLLVSPLFERIVLPYAQNLERLGIKASVRVVDPAQYQRRLDEFDFDIVVGSFAQSLSPGNEQREFWGSAAADKTGSRNLIGIKDPGIDALIDRVIFAKDRAELVAATRALDRVLLWHHFVVPQWFSPFERIAYWDRFGQPEITPSQALALTQTWWFDAARAAKAK